MVVKWKFDDPVTSASYTFDINPVAGGSPNYTKKFNYTNTAAPNGKVLVFEGQDDVQKIDFNGTILEQAQYDAFVTWWRKRYQIKVTDDLLREFMIVIESFEPTRVRARSHPWKHTYNVKATILDWL